MGHQEQMVETAILEDQLIVENSYAGYPAIRIEPEPDKVRKAAD